jgi:hypothetical protein
MVTKLNYSARLALEHYHHASSDLGCWNCHYLLNLPDFVILVWPLIAADGLLQTTSLAARCGECPAADSGFCPIKTERASLAGSLKNRLACSLSGGAHLPD